MWQSPSPFIQLVQRLHASIDSLVPDSSTKCVATSIKWMPGVTVRMTTHRMLDLWTSTWRENEQSGFLRAVGGGWTLTRGSGRDLAVTKGVSIRLLDVYHVSRAKTLAFGCWSGARERAGAGRA